MYAQGHIALDLLVMPEGTLGSRVDCVARQPLWDLGLDYNHGTGHGVGSFLNVHEGPQGIGFRRKENEVVRVLVGCCMHARARLSCL
jgi:Xaa-Pro aminopeptidase